MFGWITAGVIAVFFLKAIYARTQLRKQLILQILKDGTPYHGLDIIKQSKETIPRGTIYVYLSGLEEDGLIASEVDKNDEHKRRIYTIKQ